MHFAKRGGDKFKNFDIRNYLVKVQGAKFEAGVPNRPLKKGQKQEIVENFVTHVQKESNSMSLGINLGFKPRK